MVAAYVEIGAKRTFAAAVEWPGWCRSGKDEDQALTALAAYAPRYAEVVAEAGMKFGLTPATPFDVKERLPGSATTDFGAPGAIPALDRRPLAAKEAQRLCDLLAASWRVFDRVVDGAPASLRKGPRGGGRDRDKIVSHVLEAENAYARKVGVRCPPPDPGDASAIAAHREALLAAVRSPPPDPGPKAWPMRYGVRRTVWHVLDHAWEIEDRSD